MAKKTSRTKTTTDAPQQAADTPGMAASAGAATAPTSAGAELAPPEYPSEEAIRERAYQRYLQRGGGHGMDFDDWLEAERELRKGQIDRVR